MAYMQVLGPLGAEVAGETVDLGGPRQRAVLAVLLAARGQVVSVDRLIEDLWRGEPPPRATASLQAYISNLRRVVEPDRGPRTPARILISAPPGYAIRLGTDEVDAWRFEALLSSARQVATAEPARARAQVCEALLLWRGPAFAEVADEPWAALEAARLEELRVVARELHVEVCLRTGAAAEIAPAAEILTREQPLREEGWRLYALALWACGRQAEALAALRRARTMFADELGLDPGPALTDLESAILTQRSDVLAAATQPPAQRPVVPLQDALAGTPPLQDAVAGTPARQAVDRQPLFVGREAELARLHAAAERARTLGPVFVTVAGDAGVGKSSLLQRLRRELEADGWSTFAGRCPETEDAPPAWAWTQALRGLAAWNPPADLADEVAPLLGDEAAPAPDAVTGRFRLHAAVTRWLTRAAGQRPLVIIIDDLHDADAETLALLSSLAASIAGAPLLMITAFRPAHGNPRLTEILAVLARREPYRIDLGGLALSDVEILLAAEHGHPVDTATAKALTERTGGNPFYVRESARLLASEGALVAVSEVPQGVRDVLRRRTARLPGSAMTVLRLAAVVGPEVELEVLIDAADTDEEGVLDACDAGIIAGLLDEPAPGWIRFVHALVRDTLYTDLSLLRRTRMHARVAEAIRRLRPDDLTALAHHYAQAASSEMAWPAVEYGIAAARLAERRYASDAEVALLSQALAALDRVPAGVGPSDREALRIDVMGQLLRAQVRAGAILAARETRDRAVELARQCRRDDLLIAAFTAWSEPTPWLTHTYGWFDEKAIGALKSLLARPDLDPVTRCRLLAALAAELEGRDDPDAAAVSTEAVELARACGEPSLIALALTARARVTTPEQEPGLWKELGAEIAALGAEHDLPAYRWYAEHLAARVAAARNDPASVREHADRALELARAFQMGDPESVSLSTAAMLAHIAGDHVEAERLYRQTTDQMARLGSPHAAAFRAQSLATLLIDQGRFAEALALVEPLFTDFPVAADGIALTLAHTGHIDRAYAVLRAAPPLHHDYFFTMFATLRAMAVVALGERTAAPGLIADLLPFRDQVAGAASSSLAIRPVAHTLGTLYELLGDMANARRHYSRAVEIAQRWDAPLWLAEAAKALQAATK